MDSSYFLISNSSACPMSCTSDGGGGSGSTSNTSSSSPTPFGADFEHIGPSSSPLASSMPFGVGSISCLNPFDQFDSFIPYLDHGGARPTTQAQAQHLPSSTSNSQISTNANNTNNSQQQLNHSHHLNYHDYHLQPLPKTTNTTATTSHTTANNRDAGLACDSVGASPPNTSASAASSSTSSSNGALSTTGTPLPAASLINVCAGVDDDDDLITGTLASFIVDPCDPLASAGAEATVCGHDSDGGYTSGVDLFSSNSFVGDASDSTDDNYCFTQFALDTSSNILGAHQADHHHLSHHNHNLHHRHSHSFISNSHHTHYLDDHHLPLSSNGGTSHYHHHHGQFHDTHSGITHTSLNSSVDSPTLGSSSSYSDILNGNDYFVGIGTLSHNLGSNCHNYTNNNNNTNIAPSAPMNFRQQKRSVLMNLLIDGSDINAGYADINCRQLA